MRRQKLLQKRFLENEKRSLELEQQLEENRNTFKEASEEKRLIDARNRAQADRAGASASSVAGAIAMQEVVLRKCIDLNQLQTKEAR